MSLLSVLNIANRGLTASQLGLDVTSQNIANADTEGYSRKRITVTADYRYESAFGQIGNGVEVVNIARMRNTSIDTQIQRQNHQLGYFEELDNSMESIENIFNEPSDTGIASHLDKFFDSWNNLASNPKDLAARSSVKTAAETLTGVFKNASLQLDKLQESRNSNVAAMVDKINKLGKEIYSLNNEISGVELGGQNANDSRDRRDILMRDLSKMVDYDVVEGDRGQIMISIGGNIFVSGVSFNEVATYSGGEVQNSTTFLQYGIKMKGVNHPLQINGGELKALMDVRDTQIPQVRSNLDQLAVTITESINEQHRQGFNLNGFFGFDFFDPTATGASSMSISASVAANVANIAAARGGSQTTAPTNAIPAGDLNFGNSPVQLSKLLRTQPIDPAKNIAAGSFSLKLATTGGALQEGTDYSVNYIDGTVQMLHPGYNGIALNADFSYTNGSFPGPGNNENAIKMAALRDTLTLSPDRLGNLTSSFSDYYSGMIGSIGLERTEAISNRETREYIILQYDASQESVAGVSLDEEMANLIKYQHTYQAAAKIVTTAQQMLDILMNL